jgi:putative acyl-CoA dehydrogenase
MANHEVGNQVSPRVDIDEYATNTPLVEAVTRHDAAWATDQLHRVGTHVSTPEFQHDAELANAYVPKLHQYDRYGNRIDEVEYDESYHRIMAAHLKEGGHSSMWEDPKPGANVARAAVFMMFAQVEAGHACPVSMTHAAVPVIRNNDDLAKIWIPRLLSRDYDPNLTPGKGSAIFGMAMTEKQGGSDIRANTTQATPAGGTYGEGAYVLNGHKWFCSAPMSDGFLVLAQTPAGVTCFLVPRVLPDGSRNNFTIARLKDKLGNKSNASSEIEFDGTVGFLVGEEGRGVRTIIDMVSLTRLDTMLGSVAGMRQATAEALWHVRHRRAFGATLVDQPAMTAVVADLALETEGATALAMRVARAYDDDAPDADKAFRRIATAVGKYWICKRGPGHAYEALECLGGNGYAENFPLARRYREQPVMAIWEGSGNVIALDLIRALNTEPDAFTAFIDELALAAGENPAFDEHLAITEQRAREAADLDPATAAANARGLMADLALALEASLLIRHAPAPVADLFVESRLGEGARYGHLYGALPAGGDPAAVLERS